MRKLGGVDISNSQGDASIIGPKPSGAGESDLNGSKGDEVLLSEDECPYLSPSFDFN